MNVNMGKDSDVSTFNLEQIISAGKAGCSTCPTVVLFKFPNEIVASVY